MSMLSALRTSQHSCIFSRTPFSSILMQRASRCYSTEDAPPPFLQRIKADLKTAMRAKDTPRLSVLRAILSANLNASKTASPIQTDVQLVALIRRIQKSAQDAVEDAKTAGRDDLINKEMEQIRIMDEYIAGSGVQALGEAELKALAQDAIEASKAAGTTTKAVVGDVMKRLAGALEGKDVDRKALAAMIKELAGQ
ncbi:hypothetical protein E4U17_002404 [Claviceps sp. LM77 group G4]|nr:hypothetical protein E4U17_002404 [Claviceps sp. LM77 group G4]KAG6077309.1 hypothetical protein E4U33_001336 [Claviceps sp. LM78 group G4]KAG6083189.1 hypothetical protein E4U16_004784 [Claviceps sp. LM84 group G4]